MALTHYKERIYSQAAYMDDFIFVLMKQRNKRGKWTKEEIDRLEAYIKRLSVSVPFLFLFLFPYGFLMLPLLAKFLDRRKTVRTLSPAESTGCACPAD